MERGTQRPAYVQADVNYYEYVVLYTNEGGEMFGIVRSSSSARQAMLDFELHMQAVQDVRGITVQGAFKVQPTWLNARITWRSRKRGRHEAATA